MKKILSITIATLVWCTFTTSCVKETGFENRVREIVQIDSIKSALEGLISRIQKIVVIPDYTDGSVEVAEDTVDIISFDIAPAGIADSLAIAWARSSAEEREAIFSFKIKEVKTKTHNDTPEAEIDTVYFKDGELKVGVKFVELPKNAVASFQIRYGQSESLSEYFSIFLVPIYPEAPDMPCVKINGIWWASVNCGYDEAHPFGLLYQWGRKYGQGYGDEIPKCEISEDCPSTVAGGSLEENKNIFFYDQYDDNWTWAHTSKTDMWFTTYNPCPDGWRVPTYDELNALIGNQKQSEGISLDYSKDSERQGFWFNGTAFPKKDEGLFLPAAGCRNIKTAKSLHRGEYCYYWTSSLYDQYYYEPDCYCPYYLRVDHSTEHGSKGYNVGYMGGEYSFRGRGQSVRCVKQATANGGGGINGSMGHGLIEKW